MRKQTVLSAPSAALRTGAHDHIAIEKENELHTLKTNNHLVTTYTLLTQLHF